ncbi:hypothetical protein NBRC116592_27690 [Colwellia sp. KU-HH00111]|uniref:hypothetical protein n=1 Tax=Colwellia sp. KU-HH00111 TaxID=3127652 RepID=UPI0031036E38
MKFFKDHANSIDITARVLIALIGGYILANLIAILISYLPADNNVDGIVTGMMVSFLVYTLAVMAVFSTKTAMRAFMTLGSCCLATTGLITYIEMVVNS